jgi:hypothetical protein
VRTARTIQADFSRNVLIMVVDGTSILASGAHENR